MLAIPRGVLGAALLYASVFILLAGMRILNERLLDAKRAITVGVAFLIGLSFDAVPEI